MMIICLLAAGLRPGMHWDCNPRRVAWASRKVLKQTKVIRSPANVSDCAMDNTNTETNVILSSVRSFNSNNTYTTKSNKAAHKMLVTANKEVNRKHITMLMKL